MRWIGHISTILLLQILFLAIYLQIIGKLPAHELGLAWKAIFSDSAAMTEESQPAAAPPPEIPSYEDLLKERTRQSAEIVRKIDELNAVRRAVELDRGELDKARAALARIKQDLEGKISSAIDQAKQQGETKLLALVEAMKPRQAMEFLTKDPDTDRVLRLILKLDPATAEKIFREFKQPEDKRTLIGWLDRLGQGDPEAQRLRKLMEEAQKQTGA